MDPEERYCCDVSRFRESHVKLIGIQDIEKCNKSTFSQIHNLAGGPLSFFGVFITDRESKPTMAFGVP